MRLLSPNLEVSVKLPKTLGQLGLALLSLPLAVPAAADPATSPDGQSAQWIVVGVPAANATTGTLTAFQRVGQEWKAVLGPTPAKVGELGVGAPADGVHRTPVGTFTFDQASVACPILAPRCLTSRPLTRTGGTRKGHSVL
jgi:hypothetical protein